MSTYTKYDVNVKENLSRLRNPGNADDGICEQRVIFSNSNNVYYGTFAGKISSEGQTFNNCNVQGGTIDGTTLKNVTLKNGEEIISLADLTSNVSEVSGKIDSVIVETIPNLENLIAQTATSAGMAVVSSNLHNQITSLRDDAAVSVNNALKAVNDTSTLLSNELTSQLNSISSDMLCTMLSNDNVLDSSIASLHEYASRISAYLSDDVQLSIDELNAREHDVEVRVSLLSAQMLSAQDDIVDLQESAQFLSASIDGIEDSIMSVSNRVDELSDSFEVHKAENAEDFAQLSASMLSNIENDKHYHIYGMNGELLRSYPYDVKDFYVNVIKDTAKDIAIAYEGRKLGYGYFNNQQNDSIHVALNDLNTTPVADFVPDDLTADLQKDSFYPVAPKDCQIGWIGDEIVISASQDTYINVYTEISGETVNIGIIKPFERSDDGSIISGILQLLWNNAYPQFNGFIANIGQFVRFDGDEHNHVLSNKYMIEFNQIGSSFSFFQNVEETKYFPIVDQSSEEQFGEVISGDLVKDSNGIKSVKVTSIALSSDQAYAKTALLNRSNGFSKRISEDIYLSCAIDEDENVQFDAISALQYYNYKICPAGTSSEARGYVLPDVKNESIVSREFSQLSLHLDMPIPQLSDFWSQDYVLTGEAGGTTWKCINEVSGNSMSVELTINDSIDVVISGYSASMGGVSYGVKYDVDIDSQEIDPKSQFVHLDQSEMKQIDFSSERYYGDVSYAQCSENVPGTDVECRLQVEALTEQDKSTLVVNAPEIVEGLSYSREFIIAANIKSAYETLDLKIVDKNATEHEFYELPVFSNGKPGVRVSTNKWVNLQINEISPGKFLAHDIDHNEIFNYLDVLSSGLQDEIDNRMSAFELLSEHDRFLSSQIDTLSDDVDELWKNVRGGLNFMGVMSVDSNYDDLSSFLIDNFRDLYPDMNPKSIPVRQGFFYPLNAVDKKAHYNIGGIEVEGGDWLIAKNNFIVSAATSDDMTAFDAQDADAARLNSDNVFIGHNIFTLSTLFNDYVEASSLSAGSLSVQSEDFIIDDEQSLRDLSLDIYDKASKNKDDINFLSNVISTNNYLGSVDLTEATTSLSAWFAALNGIDGSTKLHRGAFARSDNAHASLTDGGTEKFIGANDYLVVNTDVIVSDIKWEHIDFIYDSKNESYKLSNDLSSLSNEMNQASSFLNGKIDEVALSVESLSNDVSTLAFQCMHYRGDLSGSDATLAELLQHKFQSNMIQAGEMVRYDSASAIVPDAYGDDVKLYNNDYIIFKNDISDLSKAALSDFNIIRDAQAEGLFLSAEMTANDTYLSSHIDELSGLTLSNDEFLSSQIDELSGLTLSNDEWLSGQIDELSSLTLSNDEHLSCQISSLSILTLSNDAFLSSSIDSKIFIDDISAESLSAIHISRDEFYDKVRNNELLSNELYIVSSDYINAYGQQMKNLAEPTELCDAVNKNYVDHASDSLSAEISGLAHSLYDTLEAAVTADVLMNLNQKTYISDMISAVVEIRDVLTEMRSRLSGMINA